MNYLITETQLKVYAFAEDQNILLLGSSDHFQNKWILLWKNDPAAVVEKLARMQSDLKILSNKAPLVQPLLPLAKSLQEIAEQLLLKIDKKQNVDFSVLNTLLEKCNSKDHADVELAVYNSLKKLVQA